MPPLVCNDIIPYPVLSSLIPAQRDGEYDGQDETMPDYDFLVYKRWSIPRVVKPPSIDRYTTSKLNKRRADVGMIAIPIPAVTRPITI